MEFEADRFLESFEHPRNVRISPYKTIGTRVYEKSEAWVITPGEIHKEKGRKYKEMRMKWYSPRSINRSTKEWMRSYDPYIDEEVEEAEAAYAFWRSSL